MATTAMLTGSASAVKTWEKKTWLQAMRRSVIGYMFNRGVIYVPKELKGRSARGDQITFDYVGKLTGIPIGEGGTSDGNEEALDLDSHSMAMNVTRIPVLNPNDDTIEQQRTNIAFDTTSQNMMAKRVQEIMDTAAFQQLAGAYPTSFTVDGTTYSGNNRLHVVGHNTPVAASTGRIVWAGGVSADESLTSSNLISLPLIDYALELADTNNQPIERLSGETFDLFVSPEQLVDLQHDTTGAIQWYDIALSQLQAGMTDNKIENAYKNNMICAGKYRNVFIYSAPRVASGVNSSSSAVITTVKRAVMVGSNALSFASPWGGNKSDFTNNVPVKYFEQLKDYEYYKGREARLIWGLRKMQPTNHLDIGSIVISTYGAAHA